MKTTIGIVSACLLLGCASPEIVAIGEVEFSGPEASVAPNVVQSGEMTLLTWIEPTTDDRHAVRVAARGPDGWSEPRTVIENDSLFVNWADVPSAVILRDGSWLVHWLQKTAPGTYAYHVRMRISTDSGATWGEPFTPHGDRSPTEHGFVAMVPVGDGVAAVWLDGRNTGEGPGETAATDDGHGGGGAMTLRFTTIGSGVPAPDVELDARVCDC